MQIYKKIGTNANISHIFFFFFLSYLYQNAIKRLKFSILLSISISINILLKPYYISTISQLKHYVSLSLFVLRQALITLKGTRRNQTASLQLFTLILAIKFSREFSRYLTIWQLRDRYPAKNSLENFLQTYRVNNYGNAYLNLREY